MNLGILVTIAILLPILIALVIVRRRRWSVVEPAAGADAPYWPQPYRWYRAADGRHSWTQEKRDGTLERGPLFSKNEALRIMNETPYVRMSLANGMSSTEASRGSKTVMRYYPVDDPRLGDGVTAREIGVALERALVLLTDDLIHFRTSSGQPDPDFAPIRAVSRLRREAGDNGSWLVAADLLRDTINKSSSFLTVEKWIGRVAFLLRAVG